jgi:hypothetical protein
LASLTFYFGLDVLVGAIAYAVSRDEIDLARGQLMIRMMTAIMLANAIVGGPDIMLFWRESGLRMSAEERLGVADQERDVAVKQLAEREQEINELRILVGELQERMEAQEQRPTRRHRRRHLRSNCQ